MIQNKQFTGYEEGISVFKESLIDSKGQAIVIVGPAGSGKSTLLARMLETAREYHTHDVEKVQVETNTLEPDQTQSGMLIALSGNQGKGRPITSDTEYLQLLRNLSSQIGTKQRAVIGIDTEKTLPSDSEGLWVKVVKNLPDRIKLVFTQRPNDILVKSKEFMSHVNTIQLQRREETARSTRRRKKAAKKRTEEIADADVLTDDEKRLEKNYRLLAQTPNLILRRAKTLAKSESQNAVPLTTSCLLFAMLDLGESSERRFNTTKFLRDRLIEQCSFEDIKRIRDEYFFKYQKNPYPWPLVRAKPKAVSFTLTTYVIDVLESAARIAYETTKNEVVHVRHLLAALLLFQPKGTSSGASERIKEMGTSVQWILKAFPEHLMRFQNDDHDVWEEVLGNAQEQVLPLALALINNDGLRDADGRLVDQLDVENEVNAISTLIAARKAEPPISIGLFGDWGSGKSFFMDMMYDRINLIQEKARDWKEENRECAFCTNIVQIRFNAWHYMDQNLWASLVTHIFDELASAVSDKTKEGDLEEKKKLLFAKVESTKQQLKQAEDKKKQATEQKERLQEVLDKAVEKRKEEDRQLQRIKAWDILELAKEDPQVKDRLRRIAERLGVSHNQATMEELQPVVNQLYTLYGQVKHVLRGITSQQGGKRKLLWMTLMLVAISLLLGGVVLWIFPEGVLERLGGLIAGLLAFCFGWVKTLSPRLQQVSKGLELWEDAENRVLALQGEKAALKTKQELELKDQVKELENEEKVAQQRVLEAEKQIQDATSEYEEILTGRRLYTLIMERSHRDEYKEQLGIISLIREDFQELSDLIERSAKEIERDAITRVDRIVLYIDDLDRCPSKRVVEVLQAVHLLLAFRLFVVVVGVDSRWILHALREEYSAFGLDRATSSLDNRWLTTPQNYVEKIFQIPFALRPMAEEGYRNLVKSLVTDECDVSETSQHSAASELENSNLGETEQKGTSDADEIESNLLVQEQHSDAKTRDKLQESDVITDERASETKGLESKDVIDMQPRSLDISQKEVDFMGRLGDFVQSPRATKRLINVYRLIRATIRSDQELSRLEGRDHQVGDYQAVLLMLTILAKYPDQAIQILKELATVQANMNKFSSFVRKLKTKKIPNSDPPTYANIIGRGLSEKEKVAWDKLSDSLSEKCKELAIHDSIEPFVHWAEYVARYSFQYSQSNLT